MFANEISFPGLHAKDYKFIGISCKGIFANYILFTGSDAKD